MSLSPELQQQRYAAIELAYSERRWLDVEQLSHTLLEELTDDPRDPLALRVVLLLGHTRLYGLGDPALARTQYAAVQEHSAEQTLRDIADQGLRQCEVLADSATFTPQSDSESAVAADAGVDATTGVETDIRQTAQSPARAAQPTADAAAAAPWLVEMGEADHHPAITAAGSPGGSADASPWLTQTEQTSAGPPPQAIPEEERHDPSEDIANVAVPAEGATGGSDPASPMPADPLADILAVEVIDEPDQVEVALAAEQPQSIEVVAEAPALPQSGQQAAAAGTAPLQTSPRELEELHKGLLRLRLD